MRPFCTPALGWFFASTSACMHLMKKINKPTKPHQTSRRIMLGAGVLIALCTTLVSFNVAGSELISAVLTAGVVAALYSHARWYQEWRHYPGQDSPRVPFCEAETLLS